MCPLVFSPIPYPKYEYISDEDNKDDKNDAGKEAREVRSIIDRDEVLVFIHL